VRGATQSIRRHSSARSSFNPRARAGRDFLAEAVAPGDAEVSIHAPVRGATMGGASGDYRDMRFNPRARAGRDSTDHPFEAAM